MFKPRIGGIPGPEEYHKKYAQRRRLRRNSLPNEDFRLEGLLLKYDEEVSLYLSINPAPLQLFRREGIRYVNFHKKSAAVAGCKHIICNI